MSYQVLARKYRPASFQDLEGQEHVLQALVNALDNNRLHHAYLFTGTRGVGKTTIARILARCLNCENGVTSRPCGECSSCSEISEGRSVDLIEVDAASRTGVDDMRELLSNVQYMPTSSRFKIYLIDEVHMLSGSSFNAMLKTLEEPPEHVKFLFATTDPKKLPITVLSRCLQFNLKNLSPEQIHRYLGIVLEKESIAFDDAALWQLGHAADGSMRDALSLTDQAISFGNNEVRDAPVKAMLGSIDHQEVYDLLDAISTNNGEALLNKIADLAEFAPDYSGLLDNLLSALHRVAIAHAAPAALDNAQGDKSLVEAAAAKLNAEQVQLLYQIGLIGQRDLSLAPMPRVGFEMAMLRMLSFVPDSVVGGGANSDGGTVSGTSAMSSSGSASSGSTGTSKASAAPIAPVAKPSPAAAALSAIKATTPADAKPTVAANSSTNSASEKVGPAVKKLAESAIDKTDGRQAVPKTSPVTTIDVNAESSTAKNALTDISNDRPREVLNLGQRAAPVLSTIEAVPPQNAESQSSSDITAHTPLAEKTETAPPLTTTDWPFIMRALKLSGVTQNLAANCQLDSTENDHCMLRLDEHHASMWNKSHEGRISDALSALYQRPIRVSVEVGATNVETPAQLQARQKEESFAAALTHIESDVHVQQLIEGFNGHLDRESISPLSSRRE